jgi:glycosyltransferase involved in cell wall biosynthesis
VAERPYLLLPAALERHKNVEVLIRGLGLCSDRDLELWLANPATIDPRHADRLWALADEMGVRNRIRQLGAIPYAELGPYYRGATALALPSFLETFGHPVLEAMVVGVPLVLSDIPTFREIAGDVAVYFDPLDPKAFAGCVDRLGAEPEATRERVEQGRRRAAGFSWAASVDALCRVFDEVLDEPRR